MQTLLSINLYICFSIRVLIYRCLSLSLSIQLTALAVLSASVPAIAREPAVSVLARAAMEVRASVGTAASVTRAAAQRDHYSAKLHVVMRNFSTETFIAVACNV